MSKLIVGSLVRLNGIKSGAGWLKNFEQAVRKSAQMCKIEVARGYSWGKVKQTNMDAQKVCFWCVSA